MEQKTYMVVASQYQLKTPISLTKGIYDKNGQKVLIKKDKVVKRSVVEDDEHQNNNSLWVIDEEKTAEFYKAKEVRLKEQEIQRKKESVSMSDLVSVVAEAVTPKPKKATKKAVKPEDSEVEKIKAELDEKGIKYHHKAGLDKLKELNQ